MIAPFIEALSTLRDTALLRACHTQALVSIFPDLDELADNTSQTLGFSLHAYSLPGAWPVKPKPSEEHRELGAPLASRGRELRDPGVSGACRDPWLQASPPPEQVEKVAVRVQKALGLQSAVGCHIRLPATDSQRSSKRTVHSFPILGIVRRWWPSWPRPRSREEC